MLVICPKVGKDERDSKKDKSFIQYMVCAAQVRVQESLVPSSLLTSDSSGAEVDGFSHRISCKQLKRQPLFVGLARSNTPF